MAEDNSDLCVSTLLPEEYFYTDIDLIHQFSLQVENNIDLPKQREHGLKVFYMGCDDESGSDSRAGNITHRLQYKISL